MSALSIFLYILFKCKGRVSLKISRAQCASAVSTHSVIKKNWPCLKVNNVFKTEFFGVNCHIWLLIKQQCSKTNKEKENTNISTVPVLSYSGTQYGGCLGKKINQSVFFPFFGINVSDVWIKFCWFLLTFFFCGLKNEKLCIYYTNSLFQLKPKLKKMFFLLSS